MSPLGIGPFGGESEGKEEMGREISNVLPSLPSLVQGVPCGTVDISGRVSLSWGEGVVWALGEV